MARRGLIVPSTHESIAMVSLSGSAYEGLHHFSRYFLLHPVDLLFCWFSMEEPMSNRQAACLTNFFLSLPPTTLLRQVNLGFGAPMSFGQFSGLMRALGQIRCCHLSFSGASLAFSQSLVDNQTAPPDTDPAFTHLTEFHPSAGAFFSAPAGPITLQIINQAPLQELHLENLNLSVTTWQKLLPSLFIPTLERLKVDATMRSRQLITFLNRHPGLCELCISPGD